jgi:hypothetical protein
MNVVAYRKEHISRESIDEYESVRMLPMRRPESVLLFFKKDLP